MVTLWFFLSFFLYKHFVSLQSAPLISHCQINLLSLWYLVLFKTFFPHLGSLSSFKTRSLKIEYNGYCTFLVRNLWWVFIFSAFLFLLLGYWTYDSLFCYLSLQEMLLLCSSSWLQCMYHWSYKISYFCLFNSFLQKGVDVYNPILSFHVVLFYSWTCRIYY